MSPAEALALLAATPMRPMTEQDRMGFQGCESEQPMIGESADEKWLLIVDGPVVQLLPCDPDGAGDMITFELGFG